MGHSVIEKPSWIGVKLEGQMCLLSFKNTFSSSTLIKLSWVKLSEHLKQNKSEQASNIGFKERVCGGGEGGGATDLKSWKPKKKKIKK